CYTNADQFAIQVSTSPNFESGNRFEQQVTNPGADASGNLTFNLGAIRVPNVASDTTPTIYVRVGAKNSHDSPGPSPDPITGETFIFSPASPFSFMPTAGSFSYTRRLGAPARRSTAAGSIGS